VQSSEKSPFLAPFLWLFCSFRHFAAFLDELIPAFASIRKHGISVQVVETGDGGNRYVIVKGTSVKQINKDSELIKYADDLN